MYHVEDEIAAMLNRKLSSVELEDDKARIVFRFQDGHRQAFAVEGDCCSTSWIEHLEVPGNIDGATLLSVSEDNMDATEDDGMNPKRPDGDEYMPREHESLNVYNARFKTDRGDIVLEFRNSSNGYYGGYLVPAPIVE